MLRRPSLPQETSEERGSERTADVWTALAPIEAPVCESPTQCARRCYVDPEICQLPFSIGRNVVGGVLFGGLAKPAESEQTIVQSDGDRACHVVVAVRAARKRLGVPGRNAVRPPATTLRLSSIRATAGP